MRNMKLLTTDWLTGAAQELVSQPASQYILYDNLSWGEHHGPQFAGTNQLN